MRLSRHACVQPCCLLKKLSIDAVANSARYNVKALRPYAESVIPQRFFYPSQTLKRPKIWQPTRPPHSASRGRVGSDRDPRDRGIQRPNAPIFASGPCRKPWRVRQIETAMTRRGVVALRRVRRPIGGTGGHQHFVPTPSLALSAYKLLSRRNRLFLKKQAQRLPHDL